jgi:hypothetical protein
MPLLSKGVYRALVLIVLTLLWPASIFAQDADGYLKPYQPNAHDGMRGLDLQTPIDEKNEDDKKLGLEANPWDRRVGLPASATERGAFMSPFGNSREASIRVTKIRFKDGRHATPGIYDEIYFSTKRDSAC